MPLHAFDGVSLASRRFELAAEHVGGLALIRDELFDPSPHPILDPGDLAADLLDVGLAATVALALTPQPCVLIAQVCNRPANAAIQAELVARP
jgi:hypothetical protein